MNPALLHPFDYPLAPDNDYLGSERGYHSSTAPFSSNDYLNGFRNTIPLTSNALSSGAVPVNSTVKYSTQPVFHDSVYHPTSSPLLSPPDSLSGPVSRSGSSIPSIAQQGLPKLCPGNPSSSEYTTATAPFLQVWNDPNMSDIHSRHRVHPLHPATLSSPLTYNTSSGPPAVFLSNPRGLTDPYLNHYSTNRSLLGHSQPGFTDPNKYPITYSQYGRADHNPTSIMSSTLYQTPLTPGTNREQTRPQEGPPFNKTEIMKAVVTMQNQPVGLDISASIQKGFFRVEGQWTCYRRNYFTVACSMDVKNMPVDGQYYLQRPHHNLELITKFAVSISAKTSKINNQESEARGLVQHTPKRNKESETVPGRKVIQPQMDSSIATARGLGIHTYGSSQHMMSTAGSPFDMYGLAQSTTPSTSQIFERIQFQKATANNGKRRAQQQYFHIVVELSADVSHSGPECWVTVATRESDQMVVRGRSPGHYKDGSRRDSTASMDPDRGTGASGDSGTGSVAMGSMLGDNSQSAAMEWGVAQRNGHHYGGSSYRQAVESDCSRSSDSFSSRWVQTPPGSEENKDGQGITATHALMGNGMIQGLHCASAGTNKLVVSPRYHLASHRQSVDDEAHRSGSSYSSHQTLPDGQHGTLMRPSLPGYSQAVCAP